MPPERKADIVRELVKNEPQAAAAASTALEERHEEWKATRPTQPDQAGETSRDEHIAAQALLVKLRSVHRTMAEVAALSQDIRGVGEDELRSAVLSEIEWLRSVCDIIEAAVNGGPLDSQLRALLDSEAGR